MSVNQNTLTLSTVTAAATIANIFAGQRIADIPAQLGTRFRCTYCSNANIAGITETVFVGNNRQPVQSSAVSVDAVEERIVTRDDVVCTFEADAGEKIVVTVVSPGAGIHMARLITTPIL